MRLLILDDEPAIVSLLSRVCTAAGHEAVTFTSPMKALAYLTTQPVDLLITDLAMPDLDGVAVMREARRVQPSIFTLIITGHAGSFPLEEILSDGMADVMFKPFHVRELRARLALAERRKHVIDDLHHERRELQAVSTEMIQGLQTELEALRRPGALAAPEPPARP